MQAKQKDMAQTVTADATALRHTHSELFICRCFPFFFCQKPVVCSHQQVAEVFQKPELLLVQLINPWQLCRPSKQLKEYAQVNVLNSCLHSTAQHSRFASEVYLPG